ncbi:MAG: MFS transporter [Niabella sp.]
MNLAILSPFKSRNYRLYFSGQSMSLIGTWMQKTAVSWVVYSLTNSKFMLGLSLFASMFPTFLLTSLGGVVADRYNRHKVLIITQVISMVQAVLLTLLIYFGHYVIWEVIALSVLLGIVNAFDVPARQSLVYEMVDDKKYLPNALALNSSMVNLSRLIGPAIAGFIIEAFGDAVCFGLNALSFIAVIISLLSMRLPQYTQKPHVKSVFGELEEGWNYLKRSPEISFLLLMLGLIGLFVTSFTTLIPVFARDVFHGTATTFGFIDSAIGLGAFAGALFLASLKSTANLRRILGVNTLILGAGLALFSHTANYPLALAFATLGAFGMMSQVTIVNTIIQTTVAPEMRGRLISFYAMVAFGMQPLGSLLIGTVSHYISVQNTVLIEGLIALAIGGIHLYYVHRRKPDNKQLYIDAAGEARAA